MWAQNLERDLHADSVPAPAGCEQRWMLYTTDTLTVDASGGTVSCLLCEHCAAGLARIPARMPTQARANGLWHGPGAEELRALSYTECKVINLARIHVSVKRIFLDRASFAGTGASDAPMYHQKNVCISAEPRRCLDDSGMHASRFGSDSGGAVRWRGARGTALTERSDRLGGATASCSPVAFSQ